MSQLAPHAEEQQGVLDLGALGGDPHGGAVDEARRDAVERAVDSVRAKFGTRPSPRPPS